MIECGKQKTFVIGNKNSRKDKAKLAAPKTLLCKRCLLNIALKVLMITVPTAMQQETGSDASPDVHTYTRIDG